MTYVMYSHNSCSGIKTLLFITITYTLGCGDWAVLPSRTLRLKSTIKCTTDAWVETKTPFQLPSKLFNTETKMVPQSKYAETPTSSTVCSVFAQHGSPPHFLCLAQVALFLDILQYISPSHRILPRNNTHPNGSFSLGLISCEHISILFLFGMLSS